MNDRGVIPGLIERAFRRSTWEDYRNRTSHQNAIAALAERAAKEEALERDVAALEAMQRSLPKKPPGRRL